MSRANMLRTAITNIGFVIGSASLLYLAYRIYQFINLYFRVPANPLRRYKLTTSPTSKHSPVPWALITGASGGIGYGYADYLLSLNFGVIIIADTGIADAAVKLQKLHPNGHIKAVELNCLTATLSDIEGLVNDIADLPITILINNVGSVPIPFPQFRPFKSFDAEGIDAHFDLNARFMTHLTRLMLPILTKNAQPRALILNITSGARMGLPYLLMYSATKAYISGFSHALSRECIYFNYPIDTLLIVPGEVLSDGNRHGVPSGSPTAAEFAKCVLERVDGAVARGLFEIAPWWKHALEMGMMDWVPERFLAKELVRIMEEKSRGFAKEQ